MSTLNEKCAGIEEKRSKAEVVSSILSEEQMMFLKDLINENFEVLHAEVKKHPAVQTTHRHFALLPLNFRMEYFPLLVNTVMKWVVVLMVLVFAMRQISNLVNMSHHVSIEEQQSAVKR